MQFGAFCHIPVPPVGRTFARCFWRAYHFSVQMPKKSSLAPLALSLEKRVHVQGNVWAPRSLDTFCSTLRSLLFLFLAYSLDFMAIQVLIRALHNWWYNTYIFTVLYTCRLLPRMRTACIPHFLRRDAISPTRKWLSRNSKCVAVRHIDGSLSFLRIDSTAICNWGSWRETRHKSWLTWTCKCPNRVQFYVAVDMH